MQSTSPSVRNLASRRRARSMRASGAITRCIYSVVAIRYCVSTPSASRSPLPASTPVITDLLASRPARRRMYRSRQRPDPDHGPRTTETRPRSRSDNASVGQAHIPADNRPHALPRESAGHHAGPAVVGRPTSPLRPRVRASQQEEQRSGWDRPWAAGEGIGPCCCSSRDGGAARGHGRTSRPWPDDYLFFSSSLAVITRSASTNGLAVTSRPKSA